MTRYLTRDRAAVAGVLGPFALAAVLLPWRGSLPTPTWRCCSSWWSSRSPAWEPARRLGQPPRLEHDGSIRSRYGHYQVDLSGLPPEEIELRAFSNGQYTGFTLTPKPGARPSHRARLVAVALALARHGVGDAVAHAA